MTSKTSNISTETFGLNCQAKGFAWGKLRRCRSLTAVAALALLLTMPTLPATAQNDDPVIMRINGKTVTRSEFEYSYNKNNSEGVIDRKSVADYLPLFIAYKLKVEAALDAKLDTMKSFQSEFTVYRDQQIRPAIIDSTDVEAAAKKIYTETQQDIDKNGGMVKVAHILLLVPREATPEQDKAIKAKADSLRAVLAKGADFAELAKQFSQDPGSAKDGGEMPWIVKGQTLKEFEDTAWALGENEISQPVRTAAGWHIIQKKGTRPFYDYASQRDAIMRFINARGLRERIIDSKLDSLAKARNVSREDILTEKMQEMEATDPSLKYLIQEYHDGLLLYEIANRTVWQKAQEDSVGQEQYFEAHRDSFTWQKPRFKGIAYCCRQQEDVQNVKNAVADKPFSEWADILRTTFNNDSVLRIRVEKGIFEEGMNALVDSAVFGIDTIAKPIKGFPYTGWYGKKLTAPEDISDVRQQVITDYQNALEQQWVAALRKHYKVKVNKKVLATVNNH